MQTKEWFESMFDTNSNVDKWGHQFRATQKKRLNLSFKMIQPYIKKDMEIADICCGLGDFLAKFKNCKLYGFDISKNAIEKAKKLYPHINFFQREIKDTTEKYDAIIALECLHYFTAKENQKNIDKIYNALNDNGYFLFSVSLNYEHKDELLKIVNSKFKILKIEYTYFGMFSKIEPKLLFYSRDLDYILERKRARKKVLLERLINSQFSFFVILYMKMIQNISRSILKSDVLVSLSEIFKIKHHIIVLGKK